jgi:hypothetical protein
MSAAIPVRPSTPTPPVVYTGVTAETVDTNREIRVYGHTTMFYWWPVWVVGFLIAILTYMDGYVMAVVPEGTQEEKAQVLPGDNQPRDVLVAPPGKPIPPLPAAKSAEITRHLRVAANNNYGVVFIGILLLTILVSNYIFRGLVSIVVVAALTIIGLTLALLGWWDNILSWLGGLDIRMNAEGYLAIAIPLCLFWFFTVFIYDHYTYIIVTQGQVRIRQAIGDGEIAVDSSGLLLDKKRNDLFRHWIFGLGSGDLHIKTAGPSNIDFELPNVLLIGTKLKRIQDLLREKAVEQAPV